MEMQHVQVPEIYNGRANPILADNESLTRGMEIYQVNCAVCHGDYGNGDVPLGPSLDPPPAPIAHTSQIMSDIYFGGLLKGVVLLRLKWSLIKIFLLKMIAGI
jgi:hypothetical protein